MRNSSLRQRSNVQFAGDFVQQEWIKKTVALYMYWGIGFGATGVYEVQIKKKVQVEAAMKC